MTENLKIALLSKEKDWCRFGIEADGMPLSVVRVQQNQIELYGETVLRSWCGCHREELERNTKPEIVVDLSKP
jgi:hypothetical protein